MSNDLLKIGYIATTKLNDRSAWSGTISFLADYISTEYSVVPLTASDSINKIWHKICDLCHLPSSFYGVTQFIQSLVLRFKIICNECDLIFAPAASNLLRYCGSCKIPIIYLSDATYHLMLDYYFFNVPKGRRRYLNQSESSALHNCDVAIFASDWAAADAISHYHVSPEKVHILSLPAYLPDCFQGLHNISNKVVNLLLVGVDWERKGVNIAIDAVKILNDNLHDSHLYNLTIIGLDKPEGFDLDFVTFVGRLNKANPSELQLLTGYYQQSDFFILPTKAECAGIVFSEAAMYGLPVITYATGGVESYVENGQTGICLPEGSSPSRFAESIREIVQSGHYQLYAAHSRELYEKRLNWHAWMKSFDEIVKNLLHTSDGMNLR